MALNCTTDNKSKLESSVILSCQKEALVSIDTTLQKFWSVEDLPGKAKVRTPEQQRCKQEFLKHTERLSSGRFQVRLPFKFDPKSLCSSYEAAKRSFLLLEWRLSKVPQWKELYLDFMNEYVGAYVISGQQNSSSATSFRNNVPSVLSLHPQNFRLFSMLRVEHCRYIDAIQPFNESYIELCFTFDFESLLL